MLHKVVGSVPRRAARTVTFWIESSRAMSAAAALARALSARYPRLDVVFVQGEGLEGGHGFDAFAAPPDVGIPLMLTRLRTHTLVLGGLAPGRCRRLSDVAARRGSFQVLLESDGAMPTDLRSRFDAILDVDATPPEQGAEQLGPVVGSSRRQRLRELGHLPLPVRILRRARRSPLRQLMSFKFREYTTVDALREALASPATVLCLGNGPSSQHPGLGAVTYDRLFRVNSSWMQRNTFLQPDLVFTGQRETVALLRPACGFVFGKIESEEKVLGQLLGSWRRLRYATAERLGVFETGSDGKAAPTNGALMIATAVALGPQRLVVAGIDLFSDPAGAYPGDVVTENAYALGHEAAFERAFIIAALRRHKGELVVFGEPLRKVLEGEGIPMQAGARP